MRYIITWSKAAEQDSPVRLLSYACEIADTPVQAASQHIFEHPDHCVEAVTPSQDKDADFMRYGMGAWTDEERADYQTRLEKRMERISDENDDIKTQALTYEPDEIEREIEYMARREAEQTQNAEGVHVGDIYHTSWGYEQTNIDFYQVVALKGKHTMIVQRLRSKSGENSGMTGYKRPIRDRFSDGYDSQPHTVRTKADPNFEGGMRAHVNDHLLCPVKFANLYDLSSYA